MSKKNLYFSFIALCLARIPSGCVHSRKKCGSGILKKKSEKETRKFDSKSNFCIETEIDKIVCIERKKSNRETNRIFFHCQLERKQRFRSLKKETRIWLYLCTFKAVKYTKEKEPPTMKTRNKNNKDHYVMATQCTAFSLFLSLLKTSFFLSKSCDRVETKSMF